MFVSAFDSEGLNYAEGGCQIVHGDLTWSISLVVDGSGKQAPYRLVLGASLAQLGAVAPRNAEDCYLVWPLAYEEDNTADSSALRMPESVFPEWSGVDAERAAAITRCVAAAARYARQVDSLEQLRARYAAGEYDGALIIAPMRRLLNEAC